MNFNVIKGVAAIRVGRYWIGVASGNRQSMYLRRKYQTAIRDAEKIENAKEEK